MEITFIILSIAQMLAVSLGVGASTLAIINFLYAVSDGEVDSSERGMMGLVYIVLRVAMVVIFLTSLGIGLMVYSNGGTEQFSAFFFALWTLISVLYVNAFLMTFHYMPKILGPAVQAASWHALGFLMALSSLNLTNFLYIEFAVSYIALIGFVAAIISGVLWWVTSRR